MLSTFQGTLYKDMGRTGGVVKLEIDPLDKVPESQGLGSNENILKKKHLKAPADAEAPVYVENIITSKFYPVNPWKLVIVNKEPEYESVEQILEGDMRDYLHSIKQLFANAMVFMGGIISGIAFLHFYVLFFTNDKDKFMDMYSRISKGVESIFHMFGFLCTIFCLFLALLNSSSHEKPASRMSPEKPSYRIMSPEKPIYCILYIIISIRTSLSYF